LQRPGPINAQRIDPIHSPQSSGLQRVTPASPAGTTAAVHRGGNPASLTGFVRPRPQYEQHPVVGASSAASFTNIHDAKRDYRYPRETDVTRLKAEMLQLRIELNQTTLVKTELLNKATLHEKTVESLNEMVSFRCNCVSTFVSRYLIMIIRYS
jgi:hypothetical protein